MYTKFWLVFIYDALLLIMYRMNINLTKTNKSKIFKFCRKYNEVITFKSNRKLTIYKNTFAFAYCGYEFDHNMYYFQNFSLCSNPFT